MAVCRCEQRRRVGPPPRFAGCARAPPVGMGTLWADILGKLSQRKASINGAAQFALERPAEADMLLAAVVARLGACQPEQRVPALFLVDCICQRGWKEAGGVETDEAGGSSPKDTIAFVHAVGSFLKQIVTNV